MCPLHIHTYAHTHTLTCCLCTVDDELLSVDDVPANDVPEDALKRMILGTPGTQGG